MDHIKIDENKSLKILPRTKDHSLRIKIINTNIIISTLYRINGVFLYNKTIKDDYPDEISSNINFTKGYLVCFNQKCVNIFKNYEYTRKRIRFEPLTIEKLNHDKIKVLDILNNDNFSSPI
jgi:hypothetical protein